MTSRRSDVTDDDFGKVGCGEAPGWTLGVVDFPRKVLDR